MSSGRQNPRHDRQTVVATALQLLDDHGLAELTMRRLAAELDVQASALYWHVENKQTLLAAVADRILAAARPSPSFDLDWRAATRAEAGAVRDALLAYRDGAEVVLSTRALGLGGDEGHRRLVSALRRGHDRDTSRVVATALLHLIFGDAGLVQQRLQADALGVTEAAVGLRPDAAGRAESTRDDEAFQLGVDLLLDGLEQRARAARES